MMSRDWRNAAAAEQKKEICYLGSKVGGSNTELASFGAL
tara:strand:+ start:14 stop:130 length:117 start_codon:yes stop_codon:yes gene_type:complete